MVIWLDNVSFFKKEEAKDRTQSGGDDLINRSKGPDELDFLLFE